MTAVVRRAARNRVANPRPRLCRLRHAGYALLSTEPPPAPPVNLVARERIRRAAAGLAALVLGVVLATAGAPPAPLIVVGVLAAVAGALCAGSGIAGHGPLRAIRGARHALPDAAYFGRRSR